MILTVLTHPDRRLRNHAALVTDFGGETQGIVTNMLDTLYQDDSAAGYAAIQMNIQKQIIVIDLSEERNQPLCLINPQILEVSTELFTGIEACMSVPGEVYEQVTRPAEVKVTAFNPKGERFEIECDGFLAKCIQHEMDHLNGVLFIDHISALKRERAEKKIAKWQKQQGK